MSRSNKIGLVAGPSDPPRSFQGLGLPYLAAVLEQAGFEPIIFDLYPPPTKSNAAVEPDERLAEMIAREQPVMVGMTIHTPAYAERVRLARLLRKKLPQTLLVAGGHHPTSQPAHLLKNSDFDVCVIGEGEETLYELAQRAANTRGAKATGWLTGVKGLVYKHGADIVRNQRRRPNADLDRLPFPAHHLLGLEAYASHPVLGIRSQGILTYRGCPLRCVFCTNPQGRWVRQRSPTKVVDEMARVVKHFEVHGFNFYDNLFGLNREHTVAVCEEIARRKLEVVWDCWTAGDLVDAALAEKMKAAGCVRAGFGAESGDDEVLLRAQRGFTASQHQAGIKALKSAGLKVSAFFMIGLPGESKSSVQRTVAFAKRCGADEICLSIHRPYPGAEVWRSPKKLGTRVVRGPDFEAYVETERLSRDGLRECAQWAGDELKRRGIACDFLRCDRYEWE